MLQGCFLVLEDLMVMQVVPNILLIRPKCPFLGLFLF